MSFKERFFGLLSHRRGVEFYPSPRDLVRSFEQSPYQEAILNYFSEHNVDIRGLFRWPKERRGLLSDVGILRHFLAGNIVIDPFNIERLQSNGYDVSLEENYFVYHSSPTTSGSPIKEFSPIFPAWKGGSPIFNPLDREDVFWSWREVQHAQTVGELLKSLEQSLRYMPGARNLRFLEGYELDDKVIFIEPGQMILGHTVEFVGGRNVISTTISGRSSLGRSMIEACSDANLGDIGFINRWTLELANKSQVATIALMVGQPIATIQFMEVEPPIANYRGVYQDGKTLEEVKASWEPEDLLPKMRKKI